MKLEPVKKYKNPKYPTSKQVNEDKELLIKPLERWKKIGITSALLMTLQLSYIEATETIAEENNVMLENGITFGELMPEGRISGFNPSLESRPKWLISSAFLEEDQLILDKLGYESEYDSDDFRYKLEQFFSWLLIQGMI